MLCVSQPLRMVRPAYENSRFHKTNSKINARLCVSATHVHARVLGLSVKAHSYSTVPVSCTMSFANVRADYKSAVIHGYVDELVAKDNMEQKSRLIKRLVDHIGEFRLGLYPESSPNLVPVPGRYEEVRLPNETETKDVGFIKLRIESASAKIRTSGPGDSASVS